MADPPEKIALAPEAADPANEAAAGGKPAVDVRVFTRWERLQIFLASWIGHWAFLLIGPSLRWEIIGWENYETARQLRKGFVIATWHCEIFPATWFWRKRGMVVMASQNFDGEYITRILKRHGYGVARGSSSRRASGALVEMIRAVRGGREAAFTLDGPRGPRHVAKPGVVLLSKSTGAPILCFHIVPRRSWVFSKSWDRTEIPYPFTRTTIFIAPPFVVPPDADEEEQARWLRQVQETLDGLVRRGEAGKDDGPRSKSEGKSQKANGQS